MNEINWNEAKEIVEAEFASAEEDDCWLCDECGEPIYRSDYPRIPYTYYHGQKKVICPICYTILM